MIGVASAALAIFVSVIRLQLFYPNLASAYKFVYAFVLAAAVCSLLSRQRWLAKLVYLFGVLVYCCLVEFAAYHQWSSVATLYEVLWTVFAVALLYLAWRMFLYCGVYYRDVFAQYSHRVKP